GVWRLRRDPPVADHGVVVESVPATLELQDLLSSRERARHAAREHRRFGPGGNEAHQLRARDRAYHSLREPNRRLGQPEEGGSARDLLLDGAHDRGMRMAEEQGAGPEDVVEIGTATEVHEPGPFAVVGDEGELRR